MIFVFWAVVVLSTISVAAWMARPFLAGRGAAPNRAAHDVSVYRAQLAEVARDAERGAISAAEAESARREIGRRLLNADREAAEAASTQAAPEDKGRLAAYAAAGVVLAAGLGVYLFTGAPGLPDQPLANRDIAAEKRATQLTQAAAEELAPGDQTEDDLPPGLPENFPELVTRMETILAERPDDAEGRVILGRAYLRMERPRAAYPVLLNAAELLGDAAPPDLWLDIGRSMVTAAGGYVSQEAEDAFRKAPDIILSQVLIGQAEAARGDLRQALGRWAGLYPQVEDPELAGALIAQIRAVAEALELNVDAVVQQVDAQRRQALGQQAPSDAPGPTREDMENAAGMSAEDRAAMIEGMVERLAGRLAEEPQDIDGWVRLLRAYQVLGRDDDAISAYRTATEAFQDDAEALERLAGALAPELLEKANAGGGGD